MTDDDLRFTNNWFDTAEGIWRQIFPQLKPKKILEIGSFEGQSTVFYIMKNTWVDEVEIFCLDTWAGNVEHKKRGIDMAEVESRFDHNIAFAKSNTDIPVKLHKLKGASFGSLAKLITDGFSGYFDFVYIDGSHLAADVLADAVMAFNLTRVGGMIAFDDYLWSEPLPYGRDPLRCPKISIDAFTNIYFRKIQLLNAPVSQIYLTKTST